MMDDNTGIVLLVAVIVAGIVLVSWSRSWASRAANRYDAEQTRAEAELIGAKDLSELKKRDHQEAFALVWDAGYEAAARFHEGDEAEARSNPYKAVK